MIDLRTEQQVRAKLALVAFLFLPFGVGLWNLVDPTGPGTNTRKAIMDSLGPFGRHSALDEVEGTIGQAFADLDDRYGPDSHHHALAYLRRGQLQLYRLDFHQAEEDLERALARGGCPMLSPDGEVSPERTRPFDQGGLLESRCGEAWQYLAEVMLETERPEDGLRYLRAQVTLAQASMTGARGVIRDIYARNYQRAAERLAETLRALGRESEAAAIEAEAAAATP